MQLEMQARRLLSLMSRRILPFRACRFWGESVNISAEADITICASEKNITLAKETGDYTIFNIENGGQLTLSSQDGCVLTIDGKQIESTVSTITKSGTLIAEQVEFQGNYRKTGNDGAISAAGEAASVVLNEGTFTDNKGGFSGGPSRGKRQSF